MSEGAAAGVPTPNETYQYDPLYRLQQVDDATGAPWQSYTYDKTGDRLSKGTAGQSSTDTYSYTPNTHHLISISGYDVSSRSMDANGNTTALQANGWMYGLGYDNTNRLTLVQQNGATTETYKLNGTGERVLKTPTSGTPTRFVYAPSGHLLFEYGGGFGARAYIWADDTLVAIQDGSTGTHYVYTDHLGTPRAVTTTTSNTPIWTWPWLQNPFGEKPASGSGYTLNLRYPGQYADAETGLNYNYFRDGYEAASGRYGQSDPLGLFGGSYSPYVYASGDPIIYIDPFGLCWIYSQSTGQLTHVDADGNVDYTANGYSGYGSGLNNSAMQNVAGQQPSPAGPIPQGGYTIGSQQTNVTQAGKVLPGSMRLTPNASNQMYGRGGFLIHGPHANDQHNSSEGCPIFNKKVRNLIGGSGDNCFKVVP